MANLEVAYSLAAFISPSFFFSFPAMIQHSAPRELVPANQLWSHTRSKAYSCMEIWRRKNSKAQGQKYIIIYTQAS